MGKINSTALPWEAGSAGFLLLSGFVPIVLLCSVGAVSISSLFEKAQCSMAHSTKVCIMTLEESLERGNMSETEG